MAREKQCMETPGALNLLMDDHQIKSRCAGRAEKSKTNNQNKIWHFTNSGRRKLALTSRNKHLDAGGLDYNCEGSCAINHKTQVPHQ